MAERKQRHHVLDSKVQIPVAEGISIARARLEKPIKQFIAESNRGLVLCTAPAGLGKTFLFASLCKEIKNAAWLVVESTDNNPYRFLSCAVASLSRTRKARVLGQVLSRVGEEHFTSLSAAHLFIDYCETLPDPLFWVIDEAHHLSNKFIVGFFQEIINHLPRNLFLTLISRNDLPFQLSGLRMAETLKEIRVRELKATREEAHELFHRCGVGLTDTQEVKVYQKTEGWFACLKLLILSWRHSPEENRNRLLDHFSGTHRFVAEFLFENFIRNLPKHTINFLTATALTGFFTEELCVLLTGSRNSPEQLEILSKTGLLYTVRYGGRKWYRYHHLLKDFLKMNIPEDRRAVIHKKAAQYFESLGYTVRATIHRRLAEKSKVSAPGGTALLSGGPPAKNNLSALFHDITRRERELLQSLALGLTNEELGEKHFISTGTVKWHLNNIFAKLQVKNRTEAVKCASDAGLLSLFDDQSPL